MNILTALALLLVPAAPNPAPLLHVQMVTPSAVVVKIGEASLEEYTHGNPGSRIQLLSGGQSAKKL